MLDPGDGVDSMFDTYATGLCTISTHDRHAPQQDQTISIMLRHKKTRYDEF
jgi:hypothetical protein